MNESLLTFGSTVLGAVIAAIFAWLLARRSSKETLARDREQRLEAKLALALQAIVKLKLVVDNLGTLLNMLERALANPPETGARPWQCVEPIIGHRGEHSIEFSPAELALFMEAQRADLAEDMQMLARKNATAGVVIEIYNDRREALKAKMPPPQIVDGTLGETGLTKEQFMAVAPDMAALDSLLSQLVPALREDLKLGLKIASQFGNALQTHFKDKRFPEFDVSEHNA